MKNILALLFVLALTASSALACDGHTADTGDAAVQPEEKVAVQNDMNAMLAQARKLQKNRKAQANRDGSASEKLELRNSDTISASQAQPIPAQE
jgi:hypothetical protein